jgi:hypothetical protein
MKEVEERSDKKREGRNNRTTVKKERRFEYEIFSHFHENLLVASKFADGQTFTCIT